MNDRINKLVQSVMKKNSLDDCSLTELQEMADKHPYFGAAQLLLAKKLQSVDEEEYTRQVEKTALFFHNPLWLDNLLNDVAAPEIKETEIRETRTVDLPVEEIQQAQPGKQTELLQTNSVTLPVEEFQAEQPGFNQPVSGETAAVETPEVEPSPVAEAASEEISQPKTETPAISQDQPKEELLFEPYHTVDYFASQGIKIREDELVKDKLGKQLKSFTEWLKTMKRLPVSELEKKTETPPDQKVEQLAEHSLQERQVLTEAMAEVWEKQGNREKAIEIYNKLSLLEPSKSAYFAAKIEGLKKTS